MAAVALEVTSSDDSVEEEVVFNIVAETSLGDRVFVVGGTSELGKWQPSEGLELETAANSYPQWSGNVHLPGLQSLGCVEYKFVIMKRDGGVVWEGIENRQIAADAPSADCMKEFDAGAPQALRFGEKPSGGLRAHTLRRNRGVPRDVSLASTCALDDDSPSVTATSRGASSVCLLAMADKISEAIDEGDQSDGSVRVPGALWAGAYRAPKPGGRCEDAYFFTSRAVGVADGVGQMAEFEAYGVDAAAYADDLMEQAARALAASSEAPPLQRTLEAVAKAEKAATTCGAATVTVAELQGNTLGATNLGDSGFVVMRPKPWGMELVQRSREMNHGWNCPYQLTRVPDGLLQAMGDRTLDSAADAESYSIDVEVGDLLVLYTDGLTDNLHWFELLRLVDEAVGVNSTPTKPTVPPETIAQALVQAATQRSIDENADTPFSKNARRHRRFDCLGGKIDDVTVVAAWITDSDYRGGQAPKEEVVLGSREDPAESRTVRF